MFGLKDSDMRSIIEVCRRYPEIEEVLIFGSRAIGNFKPGSDVDLALKGDLKEETCIAVAIELNERLPLPYKFDVLAYSNLNQAIKEHIDHYGKKLF